MWISRQLSGQNNGEPDIQLGDVTISSPENLSVCGTYEKRNVELYLPYGIESLPPVGSRSLLLNCGGKYVCVASSVPPSGIEPGEIRLTSAGGGYIYIKNDGSVIVNGTSFPPA